MIAMLLKDIIQGKETRIDGFVVVPLFAARESALDYVSLQTAMRGGAVTIEEVSATGDVGHLLLANRGDSMILALDGEELEGGKQNRILNTTVLLAGGAETVIPVSCTEQGRWEYVSPRFKTSDSFAMPRIRESAKRSVNRALDENRGLRANQGEVWDRVISLFEEKRMRPPTSAMSDLVKSQLEQLNRMIEAVPVLSGQCGLMITSAERVLGFDIVSRPEAYAQVHPRLLRSYLVDGAGASEPADEFDLDSVVPAFFQEAIGTEGRSFKSIGLGEDYRYDGAHIVGSALVHAGEVVHAAFFSVIQDEIPRRGSDKGTNIARAGFRKGTIRDDRYQSA